MSASDVRAWLSRATLVGLGLVAMCVGLAAGSSGCHRCRCNDVEPLSTGAFEITDSPARPELVGGMVEVSVDSVEISFTDAENNTWVVDYAVVYRASE